MEEAAPLAVPLAEQEQSLLVDEPSHAFRAAPMQLVQLYFSSDVAREVAGELGALGCVHFRDLNSSIAQFNRRYANEIRRIEATERACADIARITGSEFPMDLSELSAPLPNEADVRKLCDGLLDDAARLSELSAAHNRLLSKFTQLKEERHILLTSKQFYSFPPDSSNHTAQDETDEAPLLSSSGMDESSFVGEFGGDSFVDRARGSGINFQSSKDPFSDENEIGSRNTNAANDPFQRPEDSFADPLSHFDNSIISGSILRVRSAALERLCYRATRGNLYFIRRPMPEDSDKDVFVVYTHGQASSFKVRQLAESMGSCVLSLTAGSERFQEVDHVNEQIEDVQSVLMETENTLMLERDLVRQRIPLARAILAKERLMLTTLDKFQCDENRAGLLGEGWVPTDMLPRVRACIQQVSVQTGEALVVHAVATTRTPPTYHTTNKVTQAFQAMVDVYGIAKCGEVNPGLPTTVTFPFLFAVMFGDCGHGFILFLGAFYLVWNERKFERGPKGEIFEMAFAGRYVLLLMGLFSIFTGFMYNDMFSKPLTLFKSMYTFSHSSSDGSSIPEGTAITGERRAGYTYPFGIDYAWHAAENSLRFTNSYKMKLSILLGFAHMTYSLMFQLVNAKFFNSWIDIWGNFVPSFIFMQSIFGYLSITIVYKWTVDWIQKDKTPPSLLNMLIKMFLSPGSLEDQLYTGQKYVQVLLLAAALVCVPWLLLFKPIYWRKHHKSAYSKLEAVSGGPALHARAFEIDEYVDSEGSEDEGNEGATNDIDLVDSLIDEQFALDDDDDEFEIRSDSSAEPAEASTQRSRPNDLPNDLPNASGKEMFNDSSVDNAENDENANANGNGNGNSRPSRPAASFAIEEPALQHSDETFGDIMVHQTIHTIEFCLNCVSHTASYLRLWALSLAHSQLSQVLWNMTLQHAFGPTGGFGIVAVVCLFAVWFVVTVLVLVCMEGTSAMLHALRLQWVEAMSKHFEGDGYAFEPFSFEALDK